MKRIIDTPPQVFDVCMVFALPEEARMLLDVLRLYCDDTIEEHIEDIRVPVRGTAAIGMEGATFTLATSRHHHTPWLVVKGVCDYADRHKNDAYHDYAARASALYVLSFIRAYVTNERFPRRGVPPPSNQVGPEAASIWNVPYPRNPVFTGREDLLAQLANALQPGNAIALSHPHTQVISGLGGIGNQQFIGMMHVHHHA